MSNYTFALDVDGVLTDGKFHWDSNGNKVYKEFGPDDADALKLLKPYVANIVLYTQDRKGLEISSSRATHMGFPIKIANTQERLEDIERFYGLNNTIYMGDSFLDVPILAKCWCGITTADADFYARKWCDHITTRTGGNRAVSEAVFWILEEFLGVKEILLPGDFTLKIEEKYYE